MGSAVLAFLRASPWRWLVAVLGVVFAVLLLTQSADYGRAWLAHRRIAKQIEATDQQHTTRLRAAAQARLIADSTRFTQLGQRLEAARYTHLSQRSYDSLRALLPAVVPELPAHPLRYRSGH